MKYQIELSSKFKKDYKNVQKRGYDVSLLKKTINMLANGEELPEKNKDHLLKGNYDGLRECHITPDWLLIYRTNQETLVLVLTRTGSHSDLF